MSASSDQNVCSTAPRESVPSGAILLVEPQQAHHDFIRRSPAVDTVLIKLPHVEHLINRGETAESYFPKEVTVISTTTCRDEYLSTLTLAHEEYLVREFAPDLHIPTDVPTYTNTGRDLRRARIRENLHGTMQLARTFRDTPIEVIPLVKGANREEWNLYSRIFDEYGVEVAAFYATQYMTSGNKIGPLQRDMRSIAEAMPETDFVLLGVLSPRYLEKMPPQVSAASGFNQWHQKTEFRDAEPGVANRRLEELKADVAAALSHGQTTFRRWGIGEVSA